MTLPNPTATRVPDPSVQSVTQQLEAEIAELQKQKDQQEEQEQQEIAAQFQSQQQEQEYYADNDVSGEVGTSIIDSSSQAHTAGSRDKERHAQMGGAHSPEHAPIREVSSEYEPTQELQTWVQPVPDPHAVTLPQPIEDEYGEILLKATHIPKPTIVLPLNEQTMDKALHAKVMDSVRWLAEWCKRSILVAPGRVFYKK